MGSKVIRFAGRLSAMFRRLWDFTRWHLVLKWLPVDGPTYYVRRTSGGIIKVMRARRRR